MPSLPSFFCRLIGHPWGEWNLLPPASYPGWLIERATFQQTCLRCPKTRRIVLPASLVHSDPPDRMWSAYLSGPHRDLYPHCRKPLPHPHPGPWVESR